MYVVQNFLKAILMLAVFAHAETVIKTESTLFNQIATPANPQSGKNKLYFKSDGSIYKLNSSGTETQIDGGASSGLVLISSQTASSSASISFTSGIDSTYDSYILVYVNVVPQTDATRIYLTVSDDGGSTYKATGYRHARYSSTEGGSVGAAGSSSDSEIELNAIGNASGETTSGYCELSNPASTTVYKTIACRVVGISDTGQYFVGTAGGSWTGGTGALNAVKFAMSSGNLTSGTFKLYGRRKTP